MTMTCELIAVGTELLLGNVANTDAQHLSEQLSGAGVNVLYHTAVGDNPARLTEVIHIAHRRADLLIFTGGLGPTYDDLTKEVVCRAFGRKTVFHPEIVEEIQHYFDTVFRRPMPECNLQQAYLPEGCTIFHNPVGTAPGCAFEADGITVVMLPGVPRECRYLTDHALIPWLREKSGEVITSHELRIFGLTEPQVQEKLGDIMNNAVNPSLAPYAKTGEVLLRLTAKAATTADCEALMAPMLREVQARLGEYLYGIDTGSLEQQVLTLLKARGLTLSAAESCTGGLIAKRITDLPGASAVFLGGVVSYTNGVKAGVLGVAQELLDEYGAVSEPVARAMAQGAQRITGSDLAVSVTGVAGPDKDDRGNDVGTVFVALAAENGTVVQKLDLGTGRHRIRAMTAHHAFDMIRRYLTDLPIRKGE
ncbi:MAG: competence/damage-inducible protein A [Clostridiales bacterium]|nr:competence/damage-inducible protein A [Candidatus Cacconaster stercorequi]